MNSPIAKTAAALALALALTAGAAMAQTGAKGAAAPLWPGVAPGSEAKTGEETTRMQGEDQMVSGVHRPSLTVFLPAPGTATGAAVIVATGGSYRELWVSHEGYRVADYLMRHGIAAFVLKYRLPREAGSSYTVEGTALQDMQRAIRTVRARAAEWGVDPERVGVMGFSAGAHLAGLAASRYEGAAKPAGDVYRRRKRAAFVSGADLPSPAGCGVPVHIAPSVSGVRLRRQGLFGDHVLVRSDEEGGSAGGVAHLRRSGTRVRGAREQLKGFALDIPSGYGSQESGARSQNGGDVRIE